MRKVDSAHMKRFLKHVKKHVEIVQDFTNNKDRKNKEVIKKENTKQNSLSRH